MIWAFAVVAVAILYLALRYKRFESWVEPVLTIVVAIGFAVALLLWLTDSRTAVPEPTQPNSPLTPEDVTLSQMQFAAGQPVTSYRVTGVITNNAEITIQSFRLTVDLANCPNGVCAPVGADTALIIMRVLPGQSEPFSTFAVFPRSDLRPLTDPQWSWSVSEVRAASR
ncbi:hypothetical protein IB238_10255 [Rhizobium sp. ARZ01]|uniref:hypothetical protein n=1 Tax=Rhizobium sp. ARZ01 TaxID=2769313 RepID=UPI0017826E01|nr:hypothetical protein [Rhizobium sp. ARZ01]MBD9373000.1 hypothetical protein [Rhizobium sp. ARZ01]